MRTITTAVTVVLCTYNRCHSLCVTLANLAEQVVPAHVEWHVLVIDNNSTDQTREVVEEFARRCPDRFTYVLELQQGKSFALNTALQSIESDLVAFVDDDVTIERTWLAHLTAAFAENDCVGVAGRIRSLWSCNPPSWLRLSGPYSLASVLVGFDLGDEPLTLSIAPFGANMAFRREVFVRYGGFRTDLGPSPGSQIRGEDSEFCRRVMAEGGRLRYEPGAIVHHPVPESRLRKEYFQAWYFDHGRALVRESGIPAGSKCFRGVPRYMLRILIQRSLKWLLAYRSYARFYYKVRVWQAAGEIVEAHRQWIRRKEIDRYE
jgi:glycosyltransferase involved in cell wall biosynthesis